MLGRPLLLGDQRLDVVVEVIDRHLTSLEGLQQTDLVRHVAPERDADLSRHVGHRIEALEAQSLVYLDQVVSALLVLPGELGAGLGGRHPRAVHRRATEKQPRTDGLSPSNLVTQPEVRPIALHSTNGGHPIGDVEEQQVLDVGREQRTSQQMAMHLGQPGHQILAPSLDDPHPVGHGHVGGRFDGHHAATGDDHGLVLDDHGSTGPRHRNHMHPDEGQIAVDLGQSGPTADRQHDGQQAHSGGMTCATHRNFRV